MNLKHRLAACLACNQRLNIHAVKIRRGLDTVNQILASANVCGCSKCRRKGTNKNGCKGKFGKSEKK
ncbi:MAG: hypothetical protein Q4C48_04465 [Lachnospiraceae bacterium]|nr:hypothetical protein [Lachnospiraceae bacterium]